MNKPSKKRPITVNLTLYLILFLAVIWLTFSLSVVLGMHPSYSSMGTRKWIIAGLTFLAAAILLVLMCMLCLHNKPAWYFSIVMLSAMTLAGFFDDIGWVDVIVILTSAIPLVLLIKDRKWYLPKLDEPSP